MSAPDQIDPNAPPPDPTPAKTPKAAKVAPPVPSVGGGVHFVLNGEAASIGQHRPAVILDPGDGETITLQAFTLHRDGERYNDGHYEARDVPHDEDTKAPGTWHWPE
jgi:hypothetical protein